MAIARNAVANGSSSTQSTTLVTSSVTPTANALQLLAIWNRTDDTGSNAPASISSVSGNGMTWTLIDNYVYVDNFRYLLSLYRGMAASPSTGATTITFGSAQDSQYVWSEFTGVATTGTNGSGAINNSNKARIFVDATSISTTLSAAGDAVYAAVGDYRTSGVSSAGSGLTKGAEPDATFDTTRTYLWEEYALAGQTSIAASFASAVQAAIIAVALNAGAGGGGGASGNFLTMGCG